MKRSAMKRRKSDVVQTFADELDAITPALLERADWQCELAIPGVCTGGTLTRHHRLPRGQGGTNDLRNLLLVCGDGTRGCHGYIESHRLESYGNGWLLRSGLTDCDTPWTSYR